jgi:hypothetical protein
MPVIEPVLWELLHAYDGDGTPPMLPYRGETAAPAR